LLCVANCRKIEGVLKPDEKTEWALEAQRGASSEELSALATHLLTTMEAERFDLAKRLHDELGGMITAAKMDMAFLSARIGPTLDAQSNEKFNSVVQMLNQAMMLKRRVVENLRPSLLEHFGLGVAMQSHFDENCKIAGIECMVTVPEEAMELDASVQLTLFRIAQDVLSGVIGRGGAKNVELVIEPVETGYLMTIGDDGSPVETDLAVTIPCARHRVSLARGRIEAESRPGAGNQVRVYVPRSTAGSA
jgi:signal transduction histidine kinase